MQGERGRYVTVREEIEEREKQILSPYAARSVDSVGRDVSEEPCDLRPAYQRDRDRILHCKAFRRMKHKTQVFFSPKGDHYRTRLTHTLEVSQIARTMSKALKLNEDLTEAIALGHDLGHTPFGHSGERVLNELCEDGFKHHEQSVRIVEKLEKDGEGLNLTVEVRNGILNHKTGGKAMTLEGDVVRFADKIAYIHHDADDAIRAGLLTEEDIPGELRAILGQNCKDRLNYLIHDVIASSLGKPEIRMAEETYRAMMDFRQYMFDNVYKHPSTIREEKKAQDLLRFLFRYYMESPRQMPELYTGMIARGEKQDRVVCDYISGMTDQFAMDTYRRLTIPNHWSV